MCRRIVYLASFTLFFLCSAQAQDPCAKAEHRALVLGGGGPKGAFEAGAVYHLVVLRKCDFDEFSGISVGAMNAAFLAQAAPLEDAGKSQRNLAAQSDALVSLWQSIRGPKDVVKGRPLALLRFGLFGMENLKDLKPLRRLLEANLTLDKLAQGRPVSVGVTSFWDGRYYDVAAKPLLPPLLPKNSPVNFLDFIFASGVLPVYGKMPRIPECSPAENPKLWMQFGDGSLRHHTPVGSYFTISNAPGAAAAATPDSASAGNPQTACGPVNPLAAVDHGSLQQLFVVATNPYIRDSDLLPVTDPKSHRPDSRQITKGPKILNRTLDVMGDDSFRSDLDFLLFANDLLRLRQQAYQQMLANTSAEGQQAGKRGFRSATPFPLKSFNRDSQDSDGPSLPYEIGLVAPEKQYAETANLLVAFTPPGIQEQLYCGCVAADKMMQKDFRLSSLADKCAEHFPPLQKARKDAAQAAPKKWDPMTCQQTGQPVSVPRGQSPPPAN